MKYPSLNLIPWVLPTHEEYDRAKGILYQLSHAQETLNWTEFERLKDALRSFPSFPYKRITDPTRDVVELSVEPQIIVARA